MKPEEFRELEPLYEQGKEFCYGHSTMSISKMQAHLRIGYNRAARLCEQLAEDGVLAFDRDTGAWTRSAVTVSESPHG